MHPVSQTTATRVVAFTHLSELERAIGSLLVAEGWHSALYYPAPMAEEAQALVSDLGADRVFAQALSIGSWASFESAVEATRRVFGRAPTHAVLNFNEWEAGGPLHLGGDDNGLFERMSAANVKPVYLGLRALLPSMVEARDGAVVVLGRREAERPRDSAGAAAYAASPQAEADAPVYPFEYEGETLWAGRASLGNGDRGLTLYVVEKP